MHLARIENGKTADRCWCLMRRQFRMSTRVTRCILSTLELPLSWPAALTAPGRTLTAVINTSGVEVLRSLAKGDCAKALVVIFTTGYIYIYYIYIYNAIWDRRWCWTQVAPQDGFFSSRVDP